MQDAIATAYPGIEVVPSTFPVTPSRLLAGQILSVIQMTAIVFFLFAERAAAMMGIQLSPDMARGLSEKRVGLCIGTWIIGNFMKNSLTSTGAFEIFYDGHKVRFLAPHVQSLALLLANLNLKMKIKISGKSAIIIYEMIEHMNGDPQIERKLAWVQIIIV